MAQSRQRIWDILFLAEKGLTIHDLSTQAECDLETVERYMSALKKAEYAINEEKFWRLTKKTGSEALKVNSRGEYTDFNIDPPMTGDKLKEIRERHGLSFNNFSIALYGHGGQATRFRQMEDGSRNIGPKTAQRVRDFDQKLYDAVRQARDDEDALFEHPQRYSIF